MRKELLHPGLLARTRRELLRLQEACDTIDEALLTLGDKHRDIALIRCFRVWLKHWVAEELDCVTLHAEEARWTTPPDELPEM